MAKKTTSKTAKKAPKKRVLNILAHDEDNKIVQVKVKMDFRLNFMESFDLKEVPNVEDIPTEWLDK